MTEPIEYKKFREEFGVVEFVKKNNGRLIDPIDNRDDVIAFIQANFIAKSEIKEAIEAWEKQVIKYPPVNHQILDVLSQLKSTLKLDE